MSSNNKAKSKEKGRNEDEESQTKACRRGGVETTNSKNQKPETNDVKAGVAVLETTATCCTGLMTRADVVVSSNNEAKSEEKGPKRGRRKAN